MLFSSFWKRGPGPPLWGPGGVLGPLDPPLDPPQDVVEYNIVYRGIILSDRSISVDIHVHDTTKQDNTLHYIVHGRSKNLANRQRT